MDAEKQQITNKKSKTDMCEFCLAQKIFRFGLRKGCYECYSSHQHLLFSLAEMKRIVVKNQRLKRNS